MHRTPTTPHHLTFRRSVAAVTVAVAVGLLVGVAPAGATKGRSGTEVATVIATKWWPSTRTKLAAQIPAAKRLPLTKVKCPKAVPQIVDDPEAGIAAALAEVSAGPVKPSLKASGVFTCTARLDGQPLLVVGAISPEDDGHFATASLVLAPDRVTSSAVEAFTTKTGQTAEGRCPGNVVLVVQPDTPIGCQVRDVATKTITDVTVTVDGDLNATFSFG